MVKFSSWIKKLERRKIVSKKPHPIFPFILSFISLLFGFLIFEIYRNISYYLFFIAGFSFIFAIVHLIVFLNLNKR